MAGILSQVARNVGFMFRETGQAMEKLGCRIMGDYAFMEERKFETETASFGLLQTLPRTSIEMNPQSLFRIGRAMKSFTPVAFLSSAVSRHRKIMSVYGTMPILGAGVFVAPNASVIGDVQLGAGSSVWYGAVLRGVFGLLSVSLPSLCFYAGVNFTAA